MQTLRKKTSPCKYRNDPGRFFGDGVQFKAKLIGILEVGEARGDRMCQEALQDLKMAIRAAGEHKQRITIHVTIEGLRLRDEKSGDSLYHHPVHKISFIAQDMTDSRAFGYIFGSPDSGHRFFGIKTDKAASQVVLAMRDLFQVVFELKKKEIELARQQIQSKTIHDHLIASLSSVKSSGGGAAGGYGSSSASVGASSSLGGGAGAHGESGGAAGHGGHGLGASGSSGLHAGSGMSRLGVNLDGKSGSSSGKEMSPESVADLVDLEQELSSIQRGITQMERITPGDVGQQHLSGSLGGGGGGMGGKSLDSEDPFGDSFTNFPTYNLLPPPESDRSRNKPNKTPDPVVSAGSATTSLGGILSPAALNRGSPGAGGQPDDDSWLHDIEAPPAAVTCAAAGTSGSLDVFETSGRKVGLVGLTTTPMAPLAASESLSTPTQQLSENSVLSGAAASDLDVSGTAAASTTAAVAPSSNAAALTEALASGGGGGVAAEDPGKIVISDAFTDLDPLGTGRTRPYVDKKYFFQELKNPPKKVLKELSSSSGGGGGGSLSGDPSSVAAAVVDEFLSKDGLFDDAISVAGDMMQHATKQQQQQQQQQQSASLSSSIVSSLSQATTNQQAPPSLPQQQQQQKLHQMHQMPIATNITNAVSSNNTINNTDSLHSTQSPAGGDSDDPVMLPRDTDPFSPTRKKSDPFHEGDIFSKLDPFDFEFGGTASATSAVPGSKEAGTPATSATRLSPLQQQQQQQKHAADVFSGPLQVSLPPEIGASAAAAAAGGGATSSHPPKQQPHWMADISHLERPPIGMDPLPPLAPSGVRSRPSPSTAQYGATSSAALKQQTVDVISSISSKKMPHLFGQTRFSKRGGDSNTINMRRLQESDSLSENEAAPEPPPRPDSAMHAEPPPLPPKKHFQETAVMCPRLTSSSAAASTSGASSSNGMRTSAAAALPGSAASAAAAAVPPIPLPSRRIGRSDGTYPGPGRPRKPGHTEDDYLAPIQTGGPAGTSSADIPPLLPPPTQVSSRGRAQRQQSLQGAAAPKAPQDIYENKTEILQHQMQQQQHPPREEAEAASMGGILPDITLSQLLTLGIDELAAKLSVPTSKLSTMTLVELTSYLAEFLEKTKPPPPVPSPAGQRRRQPSPALVAAAPSADPGVASSGVFKVNFDQQATFVAKFDDTFGEDVAHMAGPAAAPSGGGASEFVANFAQFNEPPVAPPILSQAAALSHTPAVPPADRYAVFREIIDQELQHQQQNADLIGDIISGGEEARPPAVVASNEPLGMGERAASRGDDLASVGLTGLEGLEMAGTQFEAHFEDDTFSGHAAGHVPPPPAPPKIDTKITEVVAQAKDRYAALRDIILVENLFDNKPKGALIEPQQQLGQESDKELMPGFPEFGDDFNEDQDIKQILNNRPGSLGADRIGLVDSRGFPVEPSSSAITVEDDDDDDDDEEEDGAGESSLDSNEKEAAAAGGNVRRSDTDRYEKLSTSNQQLDQDKSEKGDAPALAGKQDVKFLTVGGSSGGGISSSLSASKDDLEIDELMQRAISNLSLDSRERISPANSTSVSVARPATSSISSLPMPGHQSQYNDVSTSPIPLQKSPAPSAGSLAAPAKSPQNVSPVLSELTAVSNLIDTATKQMGGAADSFPGEPVRSAKESWATFDSPKPKFQLTPAEMGEGRRQRCGLGKMTAHLGPPAPPSNASQNDTAESPCSSDPRDENAWNKPGGSVGNGLVSTAGGGGGGGGGGTSSGGGRRWQKKERQQTSSSSRDLSPWDDDASDYQKQQHKRGPPTGQMPHDLTDRHGYYMRHARRMNSCDEDYDYDEGFSNRQRKFKQGISRSRDNFDIDSPKWYGHGPPHHTWSPQEMEQSVSSMRARSFERSAYERATYGPPIYDKRGLPLPASALPPGSVSSYDRRSGYEGKRSKYYRSGGAGGGGGGDYTRPKYEFDEYGDGPVGMSERYRDTSASFEKMPGGKAGGGGRRSDYENIYGGGEGSYKSRGGGDYMYEPAPPPQQRDRKSFDRESVESFESATRRRRSFGSGEVYGSLESREDFRDRYMGVGGGGEKTRSLQRKSMKLRATGDIDYEQDSESEFHQQVPQPPQQQQRVSSMRSIDTRSLQRPSQLSSAMSVGGGNSSSLSQMRMRKSSGSSPWDGEEPPLPGQKPWKRPGSSAESERRRAVSLGMSQTPSGSDGEKDRRFRKKQRPRTKDSSRYPSAPAHTRDNYEYIAYDDDDDDDDDYVDEEYDEPPTDEDKFERLNRRRHEMHQRMMESERRQQHSLCGPKSMQRPPTGSGPPYKMPPPSSAVGAAAKKYHGPPTASSCPAPVDYEFDEYEQTPTPTPRSNASASLASSTHPGASKFSFDGGFESDFNQHSPPPPPAGTASSCNSTPAASISATGGGVGGGGGSGNTSATPATKTAFRFSNDFSEREKLAAFGQQSTSVSSLQQFDMDSVATNNTPAGLTATSPASHQATPPPVVQKLRFDDNVKVSKFDDAAFEDDFSSAKFDFKEDHQWPSAAAAAGDSTGPTAKKQNLRNSKLQQRQELIKKSESINIFAKKAEDPFEDDEFFSAAPAPPTCRSGGGVDPERPSSDLAGLEALNGNGHANGSSLEALQGGGGVSVPPPQQPQPHEFQWDDDDHNFAKFDENM